MNIRTKSESTYVPKFNGNRSLPEAEQVKVELEHPTIKQWERLQGQSGLDTIGLIEGYVRRIRNLQNNGEEITSGKELVQCRRGAFADLAAELFIHLASVNRMTEEQEKNSDGPSS